MKIARVEAIALNAPFAKAFGGLDKVPAHILRPAANQVTVPRFGQFTTIVRIATDDGLEGIGEAHGLPAAEISATIVGSHLRRLLLGRNPLDTGVLWEELYGSQRGHDAGFMLNAISGVDMALWDIKGKALGQSIAQLLGGAFRTSIPTYASPVPFMATPDESAREAVALVGRGFRKIKLKVGRGVEADLAHIAAVREAVGPGVSLLLDVNCAYDAATGIALGRGAAPYGIYWLEEPVPPEDIAGLAEIRRAVPMPIATGESEYTAYGVRDLLLQGAADVFMPNITRAGGITETWRIGQLAQVFNKKIAPHGVGSAIGIAATLQVCAALPSFQIYECNLLFNPLRQAVVTEPLEAVDGNLAVPTGPGLGITLDEDGIEEYIVARY